MKIILFGPQGAGKGVLGAALSKKYNIPLLGTGQIFREAIKQGTELGKLAGKYINDGNLVPDEVTSNVVKERIKQEDCKNGYILDGFPRTLAQTELFKEEMEKIDFLLELVAPEDLLIYRLSGRRTCTKCGYVCNANPDGDPRPKVEGKCNVCGGDLEQRKDDTPESIKKRIATYHQETEPILDKFKDRVQKIDSTGNIEIIIERIVKVLEK